MWRLGTIGRAVGRLNQEAEDVNMIIVNTMAVAAALDHEAEKPRRSFRPTPRTAR